MKVALLFALYKFTDCLLMGNAVTVVNLVPIPIFFICHVNLERAVIINGNADKFLRHGFDIFHNCLRREILTVDDMLFQFFQNSGLAFSTMWAHRLASSNE